MIRALLKPFIRPLLPQPRRCVILTPGRSGSDYLLKLLNQDARVHVMREPFVGATPEKQHDIASRLGDISTIPLRIRVFGIKTKLIDVYDVANFKEILADEDILLILSRRKNFARQSVSHLRMEVLAAETEHKYGEPHHSPQDVGDIVGKRYIDQGRFLQLANGFKKLDEHIIDFAHSTGREFETIFYEDIESTPEDVIRRLSIFFGLELKIRNYKITLKHTPTDLKLAISNFDEILHGVRGSPYEEMLQRP